jgi:hypothetical protein
MFDYQKKVTVWEDTGTEPPEGLRKWQVGEKPPAAWWNWFWDAVQKCFADIKNWFNGHQDANTGVHGVGTGHIETVEGAQTKVNSAISSHLAASDPHSQYANKTTLNQAFSNDPAIGHNHNGVGMGAPISGSAIVGAVAQATHAEDATIANENRGSISAAENTGSVTTIHSRQVNASYNSTASGFNSQINASRTSTASSNYSQVNASDGSTASNYCSQVNASFSSTASGGYYCQVNASGGSTANGSRSQVNACDSSTASGFYSQVNASLSSMANGECSQVNGSHTVRNNVDCSVAGGYYSLLGQPSTANRKWHIYSNPGSSPTIQIATTLQSNYTFGDYGEYFESLNGQVISTGYIVALEGRKIRKANSTDKRYLGVISKTAGVILGGAGFCWQGRYLYDEFGGLITQPIPHPNWEPQEGQTEEDRPLITVEVENPDYDPEREYQDRQNRPEWHIVGMLGQIHIRIDNTVQAKDYIRSNENGIGTKNETEQGWYVMDITTPYSEEKGYGVALCLVN